MDKLVAIRIKHDDGTYSNEIPLSVLAVNIDWDGTHNLVDVLGNVDLNKGSIQKQINALTTTITPDNVQWDLTHTLSDVLGDVDLDKGDLQTQINNISDGEIQVDSTLAVAGKAADAKAVGDNLKNVVRVGNNNVTNFTSIILGDTEEQVNLLDQSDLIDINARLNALENGDIQTDQTLSIQGMAADAKATGNAIHNLQGLVGTPLVAATAASMTNTDKIYVYTGSETGYTNGNWYYYDGTSWVSGGVYNSVAVDLDSTLTLSNKAPDSKVVGDAITSLNEDITNLETNKQDVLTFDSAPTAESTNPVTSAGIKTALDSVGAEIGELKENLGDVESQIVIEKNLANTVTPGKHWRKSNSDVVLIDNGGRGCIEIDINGGASYSINCAVSLNFSYWATYDNGAYHWVANVVFEENYVCKAPDTATKLLLSNSGWTEDTDIVVMKTDKPIIGYSTHDYPFNEAVGARVDDLKSKVITQINDQIADLYSEQLSLAYRSDLSTTNAIESRVNYNWEQGTIHSTNGYNINDPNSCRTAGYIKGAGSYIIRPSGQRTYCHLYDLSGNRIQGANWGATKDNILVLDDAHMFRVAVAKSDASTITPSEVTATIALKSTVSRVKEKNPNCIFICHQGYSYDDRTTNNSRLRGFSEAALRGFDWAETDLEETSDGVLVCCHEASFDDATTGVTYVIADHTLEELESCDYYGTKIATLEEVLTVCKKYGLHLALDQLASSWIDDIYSIAKKLSMIDSIAWIVSVGASGLGNNILLKDPKATILVVSSAATLSEHIQFANSLCNGQNKVYADAPRNMGTPAEFAVAAEDLHRDAILAVWTIDNIDLASDYMPYVGMITSNKFCYNDIWCDKLYKTV